MVYAIKDALYVVDQGSTNQTYVNGAKIPPNETAALLDGNKVNFGMMSIIVDILDTLEI